MRHRICFGCKKVWNESIHEPIEKRYICPHCWYKKRRPNAATLKAAKKN